MTYDQLFLNKATYIGIDAHEKTHTAYAMNRFEDKKGVITFDNTDNGITQVLNWLIDIEKQSDKTIIGIEGGQNCGQLLISQLLNNYQYVYEVNPLYTKQRRCFGTKGDKSDTIDAKLIAEVLTRKLTNLSLVSKTAIADQYVSVRKLVWFYDDLSVNRARIKNQLHGLLREYQLATKDQKQTLTIIISHKQHELKKIDKTQKLLKDKMKPLLPESVLRLTQMKGISTILASQLYSHIKDINRFANIRKFISYAGIAPTEVSSGSTKRFKRNKKGNRKLNSTLYMATINQLRWNPKAKQYFDKKVKEGKTKKHALRCLAKRVTCIIYGVMKSEQKKG
jgi:transposase